MDAITRTRRPTRSWYRTRPLRIEAEELRPGRPCSYKGVVYQARTGEHPDRWWVWSEPEGMHWGWAGDFVVDEGHGRLTMYRPERFHLLYEPESEPEDSRGA